MGLMICPHGRQMSSENTKAGKIVLRIRNLGEVPSFKNAKRIVSPNLLATRKDVKQWMMRATSSIAYQLMCAARIACGETSTAQQQRSWIASSMPSDDARQVIRSLVIETCDVEGGEEGADITIEIL